MDKSNPAQINNLASHGSRWEKGYTLLATSAGPGVPVSVSHPHQGPPRRVVSGDGTAKLSGGQLVLVPNQTPKGQQFNMVVEF